MLTIILPMKWKQVKIKVDNSSAKEYFKLLITNKDVFSIEANRLFFGKDLYKNLILKIQNKIKKAVWEEIIPIDEKYLFQSFNENEKNKISKIDEDNFKFKKVLRVVGTENWLERKEIAENIVFREKFINDINGDKWNKDLNINKNKIWFILISETNQIYSFYNETNRTIFEYQNKNLNRTFIWNKIIIWFEQHLFAYNQFLALINELFKLKKFDKQINIDWKNYNLQDLLKIVYNNIIYLIILKTNVDDIKFSNTKDFLLFSDRKLYKYFINENNKIRQEKEIDWLTFQKVFYAIFEKLVENNYFYSQYKEYVDIKIKWKIKWDRKEYSKVWQQDNFRKNNQTDEIIKNIKLKLPQEVNEFIDLFKWFEIDETTDTKDKWKEKWNRKEYAKVWQQDNLRKNNQTDEIIKDIKSKLPQNVDNFFKIYYEIMKFTWDKLSLNYNDLVWHIMLKIRKLWQYRATWIYFPEFKILAVDTRTWQSLVHETWHFVHHILAEKYLYKADNNRKDYRKYANILNVVNILPKLVNNLQEKKSSLEFRKKRELEKKQWIQNVYGADLYNTKYENTIEELEVEVNYLFSIVEKYKNVALYFYFVSKIDELPSKKTKYSWISNVENITNTAGLDISLIQLSDLLNKLNSLYESKKKILWTSWWKWYAWTSVEIFARLFDYSISNLLKIEKINLYKDLTKKTVDIATLDKVSTKTAKINPEKEESIKAIDLKVLDILEKNYGIKRETIYTEFLELIKEEINFDKNKIFDK